jgi:lipopolysaccharide biosynthesis glycosyltransferase
MKLAIFSLALGDISRYKPCLESIAKYSEKYQLSFFLCNGQKYNFINHYFEKFQCLELLREYDRVLCLDADILITPSARNIFEEYPDENYLYAFNENSDKEHMNRDLWIETYDPNFEWPLVDNKKMYFNSGCVLYSKAHMNLFNLISQIKFTQKCFSIDGGEQTALNFIVAKNKIPFKSLSYSFNRMNLGKRDDNGERFNADFIHYAGHDMYGNGNRLITIKSDYDKLYGK